MTPLGWKRRGDNLERGMEGLREMVECIEVEKLDREEVGEFLKELRELCRVRGYSITHEDGYGSFGVVRYNEDDMDWLMGAHVD